MAPIIRLFLHGWGSSAEKFRNQFLPILDRDNSHSLFLDGLEYEPFTGLRQWMPLSASEKQIRAHLLSRIMFIQDYVRANLPEDVYREQRHLEIVGHSQGGMVGIALALLSNLYIKKVISLASFLPDVESGMWNSINSISHFDLYASDADKYIPLSRVKETQLHLLKIGYRHVTFNEVSGASHQFGDPWLRQLNI
jgi:predicted esterase